MKITEQTFNEELKKLTSTKKLNDKNIKLLNKNKELLIKGNVINCILTFDTANSEKPVITIQTPYENIIFTTKLETTEQLKTAITMLTTTHFLKDLKDEVSKISQKVEITTLKQSKFIKNN